MPATGLKIVGMGACLPWCSISSSFQNSSKMSGHRGYEFLEFWCWNLVTFLPDIGFQLLKSLWLSLMYFRCQMFSIGERSGLQVGQCSTRIILLWSHAVVIAVVCGFSNTQSLPWNRRRLEGIICFSKTFKHSYCLSKHASCPYHMHLCTSIPTEMLAF